MRRKLLTSLFVFGILCFSAFAAAAQTTATAHIVKVQLAQPEIDRIIKTFTAKETEFRQALNNYSFKRDAKLQSFGDGGQVTGEYLRVSLFAFDDRSNRYEKVLYAPMPTFNGVTAEDLNDLGGINPFALEPSKISQYNFTFLGKEKVDALDLYVFDVEPKIAPNAKKTKERFFSGRVWVDDDDLTIVKTKGKGLPETKDNKFPVVETWRENIEDKYWFPTYSYANEELVYDNGYSYRIKLLVRYTDFKEAKGTLKILDGEEVVDETKQPQPEVKPNATVKKP